ncbi:hypothetical protein HWB79_gp065 [Streptomyces phage LukeCage]|jgi:hypothetical protein|uniref:Uncharacterized protein n=1 Tax=Streptomyces phage LukeCage TaxID=2283304 RepID=A0A345MGR3_9CAUD|nr:hypothetical protein HWB79_gp065 [Streptomyces phage LukeCage]AXH69744.1 hypothetical protein SEA_LUKECAGE_263 [Streptomyces phage LukeCage]
MEVLLVMPPGLEMWFGEVDWTDEYWDEDEDYRFGSPFPFSWIFSQRLIF